MRVCRPRALCSIPAIGRIAGPLECSTARLPFMHKVVCEIFLIPTAHLLGQAWLSLYMGKFRRYNQYLNVSGLCT